MKSQVIVLLLATYALTNYADHKPFCKYPSLFTGTLAPTDKFVDVEGDNNGVWYTVGYKQFGHGRGCQCMGVDYKWDQESNYIDTWFGCLSRDDQRYKNVILRPQNSPQSRMNGWMRFKPNGWFWIPFNHWIIDQADDGSWQILSEPCREMVFILSRTPEITPVLFRSLKAKLINWGFDLSNFVESCNQATADKYQNSQRVVVMDKLN